jgi:hypothetical protein
MTEQARPFLPYMALLNSALRKVSDAIDAPLISGLLVVVSLLLHPDILRA